jgi:hypothetical protein
MTAQVLPIFKCFYWSLVNRGRQQPTATNKNPEKLAKRGVPYNIRFGYGCLKLFYQYLVHDINSPIDFRQSTNNFLKKLSVMIMML